MHGVRKITPIRVPTQWMSLEMRSFVMRCSTETGWRLLTQEAVTITESICVRVAPFADGTPDEGSAHEGLKHLDPKSEDDDMLDEPRQRYLSLHHHIQEQGTRDIPES